MPDIITLVNNIYAYQKGVQAINITLMVSTVKFSGTKYLNISNRNYYCIFLTKLIKLPLIIFRIRIN